jgi:ubiquinone/menaquinone biosynthesis C-methylase UbiE
MATQRVWDRVACDYAKAIALHLGKFGTDALQLAEVGPGMHVADIACGPGYLCREAARRGAQVRALDISPEMISQLKEHDAPPCAIDAQVGDGENLPYESQSIDAIFSMFGLIFFPNRTKALQEFHRVLKPGGKAVIGSWVPTREVPIMADIYAALGSFVPQLPFAGAPIAMSTDVECKAEMHAAGFHDISIHRCVHELEISSVDEFWLTLEKSTPPIQIARDIVGAQAWPGTVLQVLEKVRVKWGEGPQKVPMTALLSLGHR